MLKVVTMNPESGNRDDEDLVIARYLASVPSGLAGWRDWVCPADLASAPTPAGDTTAAITV